jgi:N-acyl-phosphatidylethanolamine-hydrolysing phospholipase D
VPPAHHAPRGYRNPWPDAEPRGFRDIIRWSWERRLHSVPRDPPPGSFPTAEPLFSTRENSGALSATWVGHATTLLQIGGANVLTDPMWSERASPIFFAGPRRHVPAGIDFDALPPIDLALISHDHYDHLDRATVRALARRRPDIVWLAPLGLARALRRWGAGNTCELDWWQDTTLDTSGGELTVACVPAQHFSGRGLTDRGRTLWCSWVVRAGGIRVFFAGDTAYHPEFRAIRERHGPFDLLMLPIGAYEPRWFMRAVHMNPPDALHAYTDLTDSTAEAPILLPIHWGTFRLTDESMLEPPEWTARLWREAALDPTKLWLLRHGETRTTHLPQRAPAT